MRLRESQSSSIRAASLLYGSVQEFRRSVRAARLRHASKRHSTLTAHLSQKNETTKRHIYSANQRHVRGNHRAAKKNRKQKAIGPVQPRATS